MYEVNDSYKLTKEQEEGVEFLYNHPNSVLGDKPGMGKTLQALSLAYLIMSKFDQKYVQREKEKLIKSERINVPQNILNPGTHTNNAEANIISNTSKQNNTHNNNNSSNNNDTDNIVEKENNKANIKNNTSQQNNHTINKDNIKEERIPQIITIILCPKSATNAFKKELKRVRLPYHIRTTNESTTTHKSGRIFLMNYSNLTPLKNLINNIQKINSKPGIKRPVKILLICDEVHKIGNPDSNLTRELKSLRSNFSVVYGLTATPLLNNIISVYSIMDFLRPGYLSDSRRDFENKFVIYHERVIRTRRGVRKVREIAGYKNLESLKLLLKRCYISRGKEYKLNFKSIKFDITEEEGGLYNIASKGLMSKEKEYTSENPQAFAARLHSLQMVVDGARSPQYDPATNIFNIQNDNRVSTKIRYLITLISHILSNNESVIIYTDYDEVFSYLEYHIKRSSVKYSKLMSITGKQSEEARRQAEQIIPKSIIIITKAGSESINLQKANNIIFYDTPFSLYTIIQSIGRICRIDSKFAIQNIYTLVAKGTIDEYKTLLIEQHKELINKIFGQEGLKNIPKFSQTMKGEEVIKYKKFLKNSMLWNLTKRRK